MKTPFLVPFIKDPLHTIHWSDPCSKLGRVNEKRNTTNNNSHNKKCILHWIQVIPTSMLDLPASQLKSLSVLLLQLFLHLLMITQRGHGGTSRVVPAWIIPHPIRRQCFSTLRLSAIFSPLLVHTGDVNCSLARSFFTAITRAPVDIDPIFSIRISPLASFDTFPCFSVPFVLTPISLRRRKKFTCVRKRIVSALKKMGRSRN